MHIPPWPQADEREAELLHEVLASGQWGGFHPFVPQFEKSFAAYQSAQHGISTFNGTVSLELALTILGIGPGDEVIVPAISFISTATAVSRVGATPVFVDIESQSFNLDPERTRQAISAQTKAIMPVHFGGMPANLDAFEQICRDHGFFLLEDAAQAQGSEWRGRRVGSFGIAGSFSFQNGKVLTAGEGGILVTSDDFFAERTRSIANCGRVPGRSFYEHHRLGTNFRITALQAAILLAQMERLPAQIERRAANARLLKNLLGDVSEIVWQEQPSAVTQTSGYLLMGRLRNGRFSRAALERDLTAAGVPFTAFYPHTLYQNPVFRDVPGRITPCPVAEASILDSFWLPHRVLLAEEDTIHQIADVFRQALTVRTTRAQMRQCQSKSY